MKLLLFRREHTRTAFIHLNTRKCKACWECITICPNQVTGKVDLPFHKHALITNPSRCTGCLRCIKTCKFEAYTKTQK